MKRTLILTIIFIAIISTLLIIPKITGNLTKNYSYTKAICSENNYCKDYYIECSGKEIKSVSPTGFSIQQDKNWKDLRENSEINCE